MKKWMAVMVLVALGATAARAGGWHVVAEIAPTGKTEAREVAVDRSVRTVRIECTEGSVILMTMWVREGAAKTEIRVARQFAKGDHQDFDLSHARDVTGLRISDKGPGKYKIGVK